MDKESIRRSFNELQYEVLNQIEYLLDRNDSRFEKIRKVVSDKIQGLSREVLQYTDLPEKQQVEQISFVNR